MPAVRGYSDYLRSADGRPALLGLAGAVVTTLGSFGAGAIRVHDTTLESTHLSWLRFGHGLVFSSLLLWGGVAVMLFAWLWLGHQPESALTRWFRERVELGGGRQRKTAIVALARKLLVALWKYVTSGVVIEGAVMKPGAA